MSKHRNTETMHFGMSHHVTCVTHCKKWYSMTHTAAHAQRTHSTSHPVHCNIVPHQATPFINPTYTNSIRNLELKHMVMDRYITMSQVHHQHPPQRGCSHQHAQHADLGRWRKKEGSSRKEERWISRQGNDRRRKEGHREKESRNGHTG